MEVFNSTRAVEFDDVNIRTRGATRMIPRLREAVAVAAAWGHVQVLRLECAVLRLILGVALERATVAGMIGCLRHFVSRTADDTFGALPSPASSADTTVTLSTASRSTSAQLSTARE